MNQQPRDTDAAPSPASARVARVAIDRQPFEVRMSALHWLDGPDPADFPLLVEVNRETQALEARRARFVAPLSALPSGVAESPPGVTAINAVLTDRELEVLTELAKGASNKAIARSLGISAGTVRVHVKSVLRKLALDNRTQAAVWLMAADRERAT